MKDKDIVLLVISAASGEGLSPVQIQKSLFLIGGSHLPELPADFYQFHPYNYGPFNEEIYADADSLVQEGMVFSVPVSGHGWAKYVVTPKGTAKAEEIKKKLSKTLTDFIQVIVDWVSSLSFAELLRAIYRAFPQYRANSVFQG